MKKRISLNSTSILFIVFFVTASLNAQISLDLETDLVSTGYNDVRIPGKSGNLISLKDDLKPSSDIFYRIKLNYTLSSAYAISLLYSPLTVRSEGRISKDFNFASQIFPSNKDLNGTYKFNSYRLTYRYDFVQIYSLEFGIGFTAKIRDAKISLSSQNISAEKTNVGLVPIINFKLLWRTDDNFGFLFEGDALDAKQGRGSRFFSSCFI